MTMIRLVAWSARHPRLVLATALAVLLAGVVARRALRRDAIPDLSEPQIVLVVDWMDHAAPEVARRITDVLTGALAGVPGATAVRGTSMSGMAYVDVVFAAPRELAPGRDEIARRVRAAELPNTARVQLGQTASSTGWVFEYALINRGRRSSLLELRRLQDEVVGPALAAIPGVAEVAPLGGEVQQLSVEASPDRLRARGLAFSDVV
ncbi:MAG TPA: efflux RND transporter permease subunit, partial [Polyangia bacterium]|nr:efflux RND transporter permease subunit [Polyangia bacterium]